MNTTANHISAIKAAFLAHEQQRYLSELRAGLDIDDNDDATNPRFVQNYSSHGQPPRFAQTSCSQCGAETGPGNEGHSSCSTHQLPRIHPSRSIQAVCEEWDSFNSQESREG
jgi:hypothetical protein